MAAGVLEKFKCIESKRFKYTYVPGALEGEQAAWSQHYEAQIAEIERENQLRRARVKKMTDKLVSSVKGTAYTLRKIRVNQRDAERHAKA